MLAAARDERASILSLMTLSNDALKHPEAPCGAGFFFPSRPPSPPNALIPEIVLYIRCLRVATLVRSITVPDKLADFHSHDD